MGIGITEETANNVSRVMLEGRFDANTSEEVEKFINEKIQKGSINFALDMEKVDFVASAGLRVILAVAKKLRAEHKGDLRIAGAQPKVLKVFELSGMDNVLKIFPDAPSAIGSFS